MLILGIETSCDETGIALYDGRLLAHAVHSQAAMHADYGGVVPELASRDHIRRLVPLTRHIWRDHVVSSAAMAAPERVVAVGRISHYAAVGAGALPV